MASERRGSMGTRIFARGSPEAQRAQASSESMRVERLQRASGGTFVSRDSPEGRANLRRIAQQGGDAGADAQQLLTELQIKDINTAVEKLKLNQPITQQERLLITQASGNPVLREQARAVLFEVNKIQETQIQEQQLTQRVSVQQAPTISERLSQQRKGIVPTSPSQLTPEQLEKINQEILSRQRTAKTTQQPPFKVIKPREEISGGAKLREEFARIRAGEREDQNRALTEAILTGGVGYLPFKVAEAYVTGKRRAKIQEETSVRQTTEQTNLIKQFEKKDTNLEIQQKQLESQFERLNQERQGLQTKVTAGVLSYDIAVQKEQLLREEQEKIRQSGLNIISQREFIREEAKTEFPKEIKKIQQRYGGFTAKEIATETLLTPAVSGGRTIVGFFRKPEKLTPTELKRQRLYTEPEIVATTFGVAGAYLKPKVQKLAYRVGTEALAKYKLKELGVSHFIEVQPIKVGEVTTRQFKGRTIVASKKGIEGELLTEALTQKVPTGVRTYKVTKGTFLGEPVSVKTVGLAQRIPKKTRIIEFGILEKKPIVSISLAKRLGRVEVPFGRIVGIEKPFYLPAGKYDISKYFTGSRFIKGLKTVRPTKAGGGFVAVRPFKQPLKPSYKVADIDRIPEIFIQKPKIRFFKVGRRGAILEQAFEESMLEQPFLIKRIKPPKLRPLSTGIVQPSFDIIGKQIALQKTQKLDLFPTTLKTIPRVSQRQLQRQQLGLKQISQFQEAQQVQITQPQILEPLRTRPLQIQQPIIQQIQIQPLEFQQPQIQQISFPEPFPIREAPRGFPKPFLIPPFIPSGAGGGARFYPRRRRRVEKKYFIPTLFGVVTKTRLRKKPEQLVGKLFTGLEPRGIPKKAKRISIF